MSECLTRLEEMELEWLSRQDHPMWGGHLKRGEPVERTSLASYVERGLIREHHGEGYLVTDKARVLLGLVMTA